MVGVGRLRVKGLGFRFRDRFKSFRAPLKGFFKGFHNKVLSRASSRVPCRVVQRGAFRLP